MNDGNLVWLALASYLCGGVSLELKQSMDGGKEEVDGASRPFGCLEPGESIES